jgi:hypothetical protein
MPLTANQCDDGFTPQSERPRNGAVRTAAEQSEFNSILFERADDYPAQERLAPEPFLDLNLDQIIDGIIAGRDEYDLRPFFASALHRADAIRYRNDVFRDLEKPAILGAVKSFADKLRSMRDHLAQIEKLHETRQKHAWLLDAIEIYCEACATFATSLAAGRPQSQGFLGFHDYIEHYVKSAPFLTLADTAKSIKVGLAAIRYKILLEGDGRFTVQTYNSEVDYSADVEATFERFQQGAVKDHLGKFHDWPDMNHVEAKILEFVSMLFHDLFERLRSFCEGQRNFQDRTIITFDREVQFYVAYLEYIQKLKKRELSFCYPEISEDRKDVASKDGFDLALAVKLNAVGESVVPNDFSMEHGERIFVISGPNQGGKTTFSRTFGQLHYLGCLGFPVPGRRARLFLFDGLFTHFEREETINNLSGKLQDDIVRIHRILEQANSRSIVIMNEIFTSTTLQDALFLSRKIMRRIIELDALCIWVTFVDELSSFGPQTVSLVSAIAPDDPTKRTYKILRKLADGKSFAMSIAEKHGLTYHRIMERITP